MPTLRFTCQRWSELDYRSCRGHPERATVSDEDVVGAHLALLRSTRVPDLFHVCGDGEVVDAESFGDGPRRTPGLEVRGQRVDLTRVEPALNWSGRGFESHPTMSTGVVKIAKVSPTGSGSIT